MRTFYILGTDELLPNIPPKDFDLVEIEADNLNEAMKLVSKQSNKRYFCSLNLKVVNKENLINEN